MKVIAALLLSIALMGCQETVSLNEKHWGDAPEVYQCTIEQTERVHHEAGWCAENTEYYGKYCYGAAIMRICEVNDALLD